MEAGVNPIEIRRGSKRENAAAKFEGSLGGMPWLGKGARKERGSRLTCQEAREHTLAKHELHGLRNADGEHRGHEQVPHGGREAGVDEGAGIGRRYALSQPHDAGEGRCDCVRACFTMWLASELANPLQIARREP